jgi:RNA polymerase sigma-70 factor (ECF subfamily)
VVERPDEPLAALHLEHGAALHRYVLGLTGGNRALAEDVVQDTMLRAWRSDQIMDGAHGAVRAWLFTVARHLVIDDMRTARSRHETLVADPPEAEMRDDIADLERSIAMVDALRRLTDAHREVLLECFYRGRTTVEAAQRLGIPEGTVKSRTHYALRALKAELASMGVIG